MLPSSEEGLTRYLASGILPGVGTKTAERIVKKFGKESLKILDNYSSRLSEVPGLGKNKIVAIKKAWTEHSEQREIDLHLQSMGISAAYCRRIKKHFDKDAIEVIQENPFQLTEVRGIGFKFADAIATNIGLEKDAPLRVQAGIAYALNETIYKEGHSCISEQVLLEKSISILEINESVARQGILASLQAGSIIKEDKLVNKPFYYPKELYIAETKLAEIIHSIPVKYLDKLPDVLPHSDHWEILNEQQRLAVERSFIYSFSIITGGPGVGKTTVTREIVHIAKKLKLKVALAAPTGRAAKRLSESCEEGAQTIHRLLKWDAGRNGFSYNFQNFLPCDLLIVDEVSMIDLSLCFCLMQAIAPNTRIIFVGDKDQLESVGPGKVLADIITSRKVPLTELTEVYRQAADSLIIQSAHRVNSGKLPSLKAGKELQDFYWIEQDDPEKIIQTITTLVNERIPERFNYSPEQIQILAPMNRGDIGTHKLNTVMQQLVNKETSDDVLEHGENVFRIGDRVLQLSNNYDNDIFNGDMGIIKTIDPADKLMTVKFEQNTVPYAFDELDQLRLAYAITIHKSQGSEFPVVIVPLTTGHYIMLQRNLVYTAMTRAKSLLIMIGSRKALSMAVENFNKSRRFTLLAKRITNVR